MKTAVTVWSSVDTSYIDMWRNDFFWVVFLFVCLFIWVFQRDPVIMMLDLQLRAALDLLAARCTIKNAYGSNLVAAYAIYCTLRVF